jgi:hypothetical protein
MAVITQPTAANWWKFLAVGAAVLGTIIVVTSITGEVDDSVWLPVFGSMLGSLALVVTGLVLGIAHFKAGRGANTR